MLGEKIKKLRKQHKKTLYLLSEQTGISVSYLSQLERDTRENPTKDKLERIADAFNVPISFFYDDEKESIPITSRYPINYLSDDIKEWILKEESIPYLMFAKKLSEGNLEDAELMIELIKLARKI